MKPQIVLASTSLYRKKLMEQLHVPFIAVSPLADEEQLKRTSTVSTPDLPLFLAQKKAESLIGLYPNSTLIGSDQMCLLPSGPLSKPGNRDRAIEQLLKMENKAHTLITALSVYHSGQWFHHVDTTTLFMKSLSQEQIVRYVDLDNPIDCAGSYKMESLGIALFDKIETQDHTAIVGLPLLGLTTILNRLGIGPLSV